MRFAAPGALSLPRGLLVDDRVGGITIARQVFDDLRRQAEVRDRLVRIDQRRADKRRHRHRRRRRNEKIANLVTEPDENADETGKDEREEPVARNIGRQTSSSGVGRPKHRRPNRRLVERFGGRFALQTQASTSARAASLTSRLLKTRCTSSCSSTASRNASAWESSAPRNPVG